MDYNTVGHRYGGKLSEYPKPWILKFGRPESEQREVKIYSNVWGVMQLGNGHHHATITEEDNLILTQDGEKLMWGQPWGWQDAKEMYDTLKGRTADNSDLIRKKDVVKWACEILTEWGVIKNKQYKIRWDLCDDDPMAKPETVTERLRRRIERRF